MKITFLFHHFFLRFRVILGVKATEDRNLSAEPTMVALEFKTIFLRDDIKVSTNWKTDTSWQQEDVFDSDWVDSKGSKLFIDYNVIQLISHV